MASVCLFMAGMCFGGMLVLVIRLISGGPAEEPEEKKSIFEHEDIRAISVKIVTHGVTHDLRMHRFDVGSYWRQIHGSGKTEESYPVWEVKAEQAMEVMHKKTVERIEELQEQEIAKVVAKRLKEEPLKIEEGKDAAGVPDWR